MQSNMPGSWRRLSGTAAASGHRKSGGKETLQWSSDIKAALREQRKSLKGVEQIAGSYYTSRYYDFAFRDVVENGGNTRKACWIPARTSPARSSRNDANSMGKGQ